MLSIELSYLKQQPRNSPEIGSTTAGPNSSQFLNVLPRIASRSRDIQYSHSAVLDDGLRQVVIGRIYTGRRINIRSGLAGCRGRDRRATEVDTQRLHVLRNRERHLIAVRAFAESGSDQAAEKAHRPQTTDDHPDYEPSGLTRRRSGRPSRRSRLRGAKLLPALSRTSNPAPVRVGRLGLSRPASPLFCHCDRNPVRVVRAEVPGAGRAGPAGPVLSAVLPPA